MVLQKRLNYGFINGYQAPPVPRAARSARRRGPLRKEIEENQMCAFDLLATVAGKILLEGQISACSLPDGKCQEENVLDSVKEEQHDAIKLLNLGLSDQEIPETGSVIHDIGLRTKGRLPMEIEDFASDTCSGPTSEITSSGCPDKTIFDGKKVLSSVKTESVCQSGKLERCSSDDIEPCVPKLENHAEGQMQSQRADNIGEALMGIGSNGCSSEDPKFFDQKPPPASINSDSSVKPNLLKHHYPCNSVFPSGENNVKVGSRDDDENSSQFTRRSAFMRTSRFPAHIGDRRIRKLLASRYWRVPPKMKDEDISDTGREFHSTYQNKNHCYKRQRSQRIYPLKKRKIFDYNSPLNSDGTAGCNGIYNSPEEASTSGLENGILSSANDSQVRVKIKSFRVPELFIEIPETATVGSLKRTVMEAITALLGGELRVGLLVQGRKIRDDSKTLLQTGISHDNQVDALGFTLEPNPSQVYSATCSDNLPFREVSQWVSSAIVNKSVQATGVARQGNPHPSLECHSNNVANFIESDHDSAPSPAEISTEKGIVNCSRALVTIPEANSVALASVPPRQKPKRSEMAQRRIRRPFSVSEVEALVQTVEKLGTGRWRDVKLRAFDSVKHRTYVDLKDKWKTLVHTARISPQQRRGEPVPQELLDRVLAAHAYWCSQQQAKQHLKHQANARLLL